MNKALFSSATEEWSTPQDLFDRLNAVWGFELDVCASKDNAKCPRYFDKQTNGLAQDWEGRCWMNPPYGRTMLAWMGKARAEVLKGGCLVVALVPTRTDTRWWHDHIKNKNGVFVEHIRGRLKFGDSMNSAPFPSSIIYLLP